MATQSGTGSSNSQSVYDESNGFDSLEAINPDIDCDGLAILSAPAPPIPATSVAAPAGTTSRSVDLKKRKRIKKEKVVGEEDEAQGIQRSWVWRHFKREKDVKISIIKGKEVRSSVWKAVCMYCSARLACDTHGNGTSTLGRHINSVCRKYPGRVELEVGQQVWSTGGTGSSGGTQELVMMKWSQESSREAAMLMIVMDELPFSFIERPGFRQFCRVAVPRFQVPSRRTICELFLKMYEKARVKVKGEMKNYCVSLTTDKWTSVQNVNYMVVTGHYIDSSWTMRKKILNFQVIPNHSGITIGKMLESCLLNWEIERVLTISVDNASANKILVDYVRDVMSNWEKRPVLDGQELHVRCLAHIKGLKMMEKSVVAIRNAVRYIRSSGQRLDAFKMCVVKAKVDCKRVCILDVPTRWNSTYLMLDTAIEYEKVFYRMADEEAEKYKSYFDEDWERELEDSEEAVVGHEVDRYIIDPIEKPPVPSMFHVLDWWKKNGEKYPNLAAVAKDVFAIQISTVASESYFSTGRRVIDPFQCSLSPKTVETLICYQNWIKDENLSEIQYVPTPEDIALSGK